jgi:hypothetical protein
MKMDGMTKLILFLIALSLWANILVPLVHPIVEKADTDSVLRDIAHDVHELEDCASGFEIRGHSE